MCAVIGVYLKNPSSKDFEMVKRVFIESKIRGKHATGISFIPLSSERIETVKEPVPADEFSWLDKLQDCVDSNGDLYLIGHCRYSTSDLEFNQPMESVSKSIVHNGVITQELPENWKELYGYDCKTKNDSELILHSNNPLEEFSEMSMGVVELTVDKKIRFYRNGKRPLYFTSWGNGYIITSTEDIMKRSDSSSNPELVPLNVYVTIDSDGSCTSERIQTSNKDLQKVEY